MLRLTAQTSLGNCDSPGWQNMLCPLANLKGGLGRSNSLFLHSRAQPPQSCCSLRRVSLQTVSSLANRSATSQYPGRSEMRREAVRAVTGVANSVVAAFIRSWTRNSRFRPGDSDQDCISSVAGYAPPIRIRSIGGLDVGCKGRDGQQNAEQSLISAGEML